MKEDLENLKVYAAEGKEVKFFVLEIFGSVLVIKYCMGL